MGGPGTALFGSLTEAAAALRRRELSAREFVERQLRWIERVEPSLHCFVRLLPDQALRRADELDRLESPAGSLHGIPISVKDNIDVAGSPTEAGSPLLHAVMPRQNARAVQCLLEAGAIVVGKTSMYELAFGARNERWPAVSNPWRLDRATAGSSSGSAAAVAAGSSFASLGTDTGGSIRVPAAFCGVVGLRPTQGSLSRDGVTPLSRLDEVGPLARTVADVAAVFRALTGLEPPAPSTRTLVGVRIGLGELEGIPHAMAESMERACDVFQHLGASVVEAPPIDLASAAAALWVIAAADAARTWSEAIRRSPALVHPLVRERIDAGSRLTAEEVRRASGRARRIAASTMELLRDVDLLLLPVASCSTYGLDERTVEVSGGFEDVSAAVTRYTPLASIAGLPALVVPCGVDREQLPIGMQLVAAPGDEELLFDAAGKYQALTNWHSRVPSAVKALLGEEDRCETG